MRPAQLLSAPKNFLGVFAPVENRFVFRAWRTSFLLVRGVRDESSSHVIVRIRASVSVLCLQ
jgi:hypothetical protein